MSKWAIWVFGLYECAIAKSLYLTPNYHYPESLLLTDAIPRHEAILAGKSLHETGAHYENLDLFALELLNVQCQSDPPTTSGGHDTIQDTGATLGITDKRLLNPVPGCIYDLQKPVIISQGKDAKLQKSEDACLQDPPRAE